MKTYFKSLKFFSTRFQKYFNLNLIPCSIVFFILSLFYIPKINGQIPPNLGLAADFGLMVSDTTFCSDSIKINGQAQMHTPISSLLDVPGGIITEAQSDYNDIINDMRSAYYSCIGQTGTAIAGTPNPNQNFTSGVYSVSGNLYIKYPIYLTGNNNDIFIFNVSDSIIMDTSASINLVGVNPQNIYFTCGKSLKILTSLAVNGIYLINQNIQVNSFCSGKKAFLCSGKANLNSIVDLSSFNAILQTNNNTIFSFAGCGEINYVQASMKLHKRGASPGNTLPQTLTIARPASTTIKEIFIWFTVEGVDRVTYKSPNSRSFTINGQSYTANKIGFSLPGTCWNGLSPFDNLGTTGYFCHANIQGLTVPIAGGNNSYIIDGLPQFGINSETDFDTDGITLFIVYGTCNVTGKATYMEIQHGLTECDILNNTNYITTTIPGVAATIPTPEAFMIIGDLEATINSAYNLGILINTTLFPIVINAPLMWNFISVPIVIPAVASSVAFKYEKKGVDCTNIIMTGIRYEYNRSACSDLNVSVASTNTCTGANAGTATANAGCGTTPYSYHWSNGQNTQTATGLGVGTYTVTVTDASAATSTATIVITDFATVVVYLQSVSSCVWQNDGSLTANPTNGTSPYYYLWSNSITTRTASGLSSGIYTVTVTDSRGCTASKSHTLYDCCVGVAPGLPTLDNTDHYISSILTDPTWIASGFLNFSFPVPQITSNYNYYFTPTAPNSYFVINGKLIIDQDIDFFNIELIMGPDAEIIITNNSTVNFINETYIHGCGDAMWKGITIDCPLCSLISVPGNYKPETYLEDAIKAVTSNNEGFYNLYGVTFNKNYKGLVVNDQTSNPFTGLVRASHFECNTITTTGRIPTTLIAPHLMEIPYCGIELNDVAGILIGFTGTAYTNTNIFDNLNNGIRGNNAEATIYDNEFKNILSYGIFADGKNAFPIKRMFIGSPNYFDFNTFHDCKGGIKFFNNQKVYIYNNIFHHIRQTGALYPTNACIQGTYLEKSVVTISYNTMDDFDNGIYIQNFKTTDINIGGNQINNLITTPGRNGIFLGNLNGGNATSAIYKLRINTISNNRYNIHLVNTQNAKINTFNVINFDFTSAPPVTYYGIKTENSTNITIQENTIQKIIPEPTAAFDDKLWGLHFSLSDNNFVLCNTLNNLGTAIRFSGTGTNTVSLNKMNYHRLGIVMDNSSIGDQGSLAVASDNEWVPNVGSPGFDLVSITAPTCTLFTQSLSFPYGVPSIAMSPGGFFTIDGTANSNPICQAPAAEDQQERMAAIVREDGDYAFLPDDQKYNIKESVYLLLDKDTSWMHLQTNNDNDLQTFYSDASVSTMGQLAAARKEITNGQNQQASAIISMITPENLSEQNDLIVKGIFLETFALGIEELDTNQYQTLYNIAIQNPVSGGRSVYTARYMLNLDVDDLTSNVPDQRLGHPFSAQPYHNPLLYPNPVPDILYADIRLLDDETGTLSVFDIFGNSIYKSILHEQQNKININVEKFSNGIYLIKFETSTGVKLTEKFIVAK